MLSHPRVPFLGARCLESVKSGEVLKLQARQSLLSAEAGANVISASDKTLDTLLDVLA